MLVHHCQLPACFLEYQSYSQCQQSTQRVKTSYKSANLLLAHERVGLHITHPSLLFPSRHFHLFSQHSLRYILPVAVHSEGGVHPTSLVWLSTQRSSVFFFGSLRPFFLFIGCQVSPEWITQCYKLLISWEFEFY